MTMRISSLRTTLRRGALSAAAFIVGSCSSTTDSIDGGDVASVVVNPSSTSVAVGAQVPLQATAADADGKPVSGAAVVWTVKDSDIVSVSPAGVVTGLALGTTQVAANIGGKSGIAAITVQKTPVATVVVRPNHIDASTGAKTQLTAVAYDGGQNPLTDRAIIWSSSNTGVATVDPNGLVTATGPGTASITATAEGKNDVATITVTQAPVASVAVTPNPLSMSVGQTTGLTAVLRDDAGNVLSGRPVEWSSSNTGVATISSSGSLTAVAAGTTTITATSEGKSGTATITVTNFAVATVNVQPQNNTIIQGSSVQLSATLTDVNGAPATNRAVAWSSSNTGVATVTSNGLVSGIAAGAVTITATSEGKTGSANVTVQPKPVATVTVTPATATLTVGQTTNLSVVLKDQSGAVLTGRTIVWTTSSSAVATVSSSGTVTAVGAGNATITATSEGKSGTASVTVTAIPVGSVTVSPASTSVPATTTVGLSVVVKDVNGTVVTDRVVTWTTSNAAAATVSSSGVVTGVAIGTATITATSETKSGSATVTVTQAPVSTVTITPASPTVVIATTTTLSAITRDANGVVLNGRAVTWSSGNPAIATVNSAGAVTGVSSGTVTITATSEGKSGTALVTVVPVPVATVAVSPLSANVLVGATQPFVAVTKDANNNTLTGRIVTWSTSSAAIATVSTAGVVTGVAPGTATITATSEGKSGTATIFVSQVPVGSITVSPSPATVVGTQTIQLTATVKDQNGVVVTNRTVSWSTNNSSVAAVSPTGLTAVVTGNNTGNINVSATITATSETKSVGTNVTVTPNPVATVTVTPSPASVRKNDKVTLAATPRDANNNVLTGRAVTWSSSNTNIATVAANGEVTGKNTGTAVITATIGGIPGTSTVTVTP